MTYTKSAYPVVISKDGEGFFVDIPDFGSATEGCSLPNAIEMARDCIGLLGITLIDEGKELPEPGTANITSDQGDIVTYVDIDFDMYRKKVNCEKVRRNVSIPAYLNEKANLLGLNVSQLLTEALETKLGY